MGRTAVVHPKGPVEDVFEMYAPSLIRSLYHFNRCMVCLGSRESPFGKSARAIFGCYYRSTVSLVCIMSFVLTSYFGSLSLGERVGMSGWVSSIFLSVAMILIVASARLFSLRGAEFESLLYELEHKAIYDLHHFNKVKLNVNHAHHGLVVATLNHVTTTSLSNLDLIHGGEEKEDSVLSDLEKGDEEQGSLPEYEVAAIFFSPLNFVLYVVFPSSMVGFLLLLVLSLTEKVAALRVMFMISAVTWLFIAIGEFNYGAFMFFRWINVAVHSIECWGYSTVDLIDKSTYSGPFQESKILNFRARLDALHDLHSVPVSFLNQKLSLPLSLLLLGMVSTFCCSIATLYEPGYKNIHTGSVIMVLYSLVIIVACLFVSGQITEVYTLARETIKRPRVIAALKPLVGTVEEVDMLIKYYFLDTDMGFKLLGKQHSHYGSMGVLITLFVGLMFSFGPSIALAMT